MKLSPGVNFINSLRVPLSNISLFGGFSLVTFRFVIFGAKILYEKRVRKTLMNLTPDTRNMASDLGDVSFVPFPETFSTKHSD